MEYGGERKTTKHLAAMASQTFRDSIGSLGWARRERDAPVNTSQQSGLLSSLQSLNPFGDRGYVQLPTTEGQGAPLPAPSRREEEEGWFVRESTCYYCPVLPFSLSLSGSQTPPMSLQQIRLWDMCRLLLGGLVLAPHMNTFLTPPPLS